MAPRRVALITGASAGLGREFAVQLAREGYHLVLVARDESRLRELAADLSAGHGISCEVLRADLSRDEDTSLVVARIDGSPIDLLVNNAGFGTRSSLARASREEQDAMIRVHVLATHRLTHAAVQSMVARGAGAIITVSSVSSWLTSPGNVNYASTKSWQRLEIEALAMELKGKGVYVQALCPGFTHTEFHQRGGMDMSSLPSWVWQRADFVVATSIKALRRGRPVVVVPGLGYRLTALALRTLPAGLVRALVGLRRRGRSRPSA
jgi:short-subunit dehydrogenase